MAVLILCGSVTAAQASHVSCGQTIEADTTLDSDLQCPDQGVLVGASGVTLDLAGHTVEGSGRGIGVVTAQGVSDVTVKNGRVGRFLYAVVLRPGTGAVVRHVHAYGSHEGVLLDSATGALLDRVTATGNDGAGINTRGARGFTLRRSRIHDNGAGIGGLNIVGSSIVHNMIERNTFFGIHFVSVTNTSIERNRVSGHGDFGIELEGGSIDNDVVANRVTQTAGIGIFLSEDSGANFLARNRSNRNTGDGFAVLGAGVTLIRNFAARNGALGINAPSGVAFARRNVARRNGDPRQCVGIRC